MSEQLTAPSTRFSVHPLSCLSQITDWTAEQRLERCQFGVEKQAAENR